MSLAELVITSVRVEGRTKSEVARDYHVSRYWVHRLVQRYEAEGEAAFRAGLRVVGAAVVQPHPEQVEFELEGDPAAAAWFAGEDRGVVGQHPGRDAVAAEGLAEAGDP